MRMVLGLAALVVLHGCASGAAGGYGQGGRADDGRSYREARADNRLTAAVNTALVRDKSLPALDIEVQSQAGVVTLAGQVPSAAVAQRAVSVVRGVPGVHEVRDQLRVTP